MTPQPAKLSANAANKVHHKAFEQFQLRPLMLATNPNFGSASTMQTLRAYSSAPLGDA
jgi:hypothetical protein